MSWISLDDEVRAILHALEGAHHISGPLNATAPAPVTNAELTRVLARVLRRPAVARVPGVALRAVMGSEMADEMLLAGQRVLPAKLKATGYGFRHTELEGALRDLLAP
jgi:NAD dependent epimerase/dehydratase family enzyme